MEYGNMNNPTQGTRSSESGPRNSTQILIGFSKFMSLGQSHMLAIWPRRNQAYSMMTVPTWRDLVAETACYRSNKMKVVSRFSANPMHLLVLNHRNVEDVLRQDKPTARHGSECFLGNLFQRAVKAFVRSQLEHCSELKVSISGNNYDLFQGRVRNLKISAKGAVYKVLILQNLSQIKCMDILSIFEQSINHRLHGIYLTDVELAASNIKLKLKASRILQEPFHVKASIHLHEEDLLSSLASPLLAEALAEMSPEGFGTTSHDWDRNMSLKEGAIQLHQKSSLQNVRFACTSLNGIKKEPKAALKLLVQDAGRSLCILSTNTGKSGVARDEYALLRKFWLGPDVCIKKLEIHPSEISLHGHFLIRP